jgi:O-antigen/teichoic acid export membrane protein
MISKEIISFSLYNLLGNMGTVVNTQGTAFVINKFFGLIYNAAATVGTTVSSVITGFSSNIMTAFRPQITKSYAAGDLVNFQSLLSLAVKAILLVYALIAIPVSIAIKEILSLWLVEVPYYADVFCQLLLVNIFFESARYIVIMGIHAIGKVRLVSLFSGVSFLMNPFIVYLFFAQDYSASFAYVSIIIINIFLTLLNIFILKHNDNRIQIKGIFMSLSRTVVAVCIATLITSYIYQILSLNNFINIVVLFICSTVLILLLGISIVLTNEQRIMFINTIRTKLFSRL